MVRKVRKKRLNFLLIITSIIICLALVIPPITQSEQISQFKVGNEERDEFWYKIQMDEEEDFGVEAGGYFTIPTHRGEIKNASLDIHCTADTNGNHLTNPKLDIGLDGDYEWMYSGVGYGKAGQQVEFSNGRPRSIVTTARRFGQHYDNRTVLYLPKDATVTNATMKIKGGPGKYKEDLVAGITYSGQVYYMKSKSGTFNEGAKYFLDVSPGWGYTYGLALGDFDNDNDLDLVVGYQTSWTSNVDLYLYKNKGGTGDPPWQTTRTSIGIIPATSWTYLYDYAVEDFDNDGNIDFITSTNSGMYFFKGNGTNTFTRFQITGGGNYGKDAADFNNDGNIDFVTGSTSANVMYFQGKGDGTFNSPVSVPAGTNWGYQYMVIAGDFNDDYDQDIITKYYSSSTNIIKGKGDGTFEDPTAAGMYPTGYAAGDNYDFNYDGKQDIVCFYMTTSWPRSYYFYYYQGFGDGTFASPYYIGDSSTYTYAMAGPPKMPLGGCENLTVNIGDDGGNPEIGFTNEFDSEKTVYFGNSLNALMQSSQSRNLETFTDSYGNEMVKIPLRFDSDTYGSVMVYDLDIKYDYTAKVRTLPNYRYNLTTDLNDLLKLNKNITDENRVYFGLYSESPGWAKISNLSLEYNGAPQLTNPISKIEVDEDTNTKTIDLTSGKKFAGETLYYFTDDYDSRSSLIYGIHSVSDPEHIKLSVEDNWLVVDCTLVPDWYGTATGKVWCQDTEGIKSVSDEFQIIVNPVNDLPKPNNPLPNFQMLENETKIAFDLDDVRAEYFIDVDSEELYYRAVLETPEENEDQLEVEVLQNNEIQLDSIGSFGRYLGVVVYCHDDEEIMNWARSELELLDCYQTFYVNITSRARTFPPQWLPLSIPPIPEDVPQEAILKLKNYVTDEDDKITNLTYSIFSLTHSGYLDIIINEDTTELSIYPRDNFAGTAIATMAVTDDEQNMDLTTLEIEIIPSNDRPIAEISEPGNASSVRGIVEVIGSAYDPEDELSKVEISVGALGSNSEWKPVNGLSYWTYSFDTNTFPTSVKDIIVKVRAEDSTATQSLMDQVYLKISRPKEDTDGDGVEDFKDKFKYNPSEWSDTDGDGYGDNSDAFPDDVTQWKDTDDDGYGDNPDGNQDDRFPYDPTQWYDTDGDEHGDNEWGNNGDYYKFDPERWAKEESETSEKGSEAILGIENLSFIMWIVLGMIIILCVVILINYGIKSSKSKK